MKFSTLSYRSCGAVLLSLLQLAGAVELTWKSAAFEKPQQQAAEPQDASRARLMREAAIEEDGFVKIRHPKSAAGSNEIQSMMAIQQVPLQQLDDPNQTKFAAAYVPPSDISLFGNNTVVNVRADYGLPDEDSWCNSASNFFACFISTGYLMARHIVTPKMSDLAMLGLLRPDWMAHPVVQNTAIYDLTWPGTINSGSYNFMDPRGLGNRQHQTLDISGQLYIGVRAFDLKISWNDDTEQLVISNMYLAVPLDDVLFQLADFLSKYPNEVVMVSADIDPSAGQTSDFYTAPLLLEENDPTSITGQGVATAFANVFGSNLTTYYNLRNLPSSVDPQNPRIADLVGIGSRVLFFWKGQQVLCTTLLQCASVPGWQRPYDDGSEFPKYMWQPVPLGLRYPLNTSIEPACLAPADKFSGMYLVSDEERWVDGAKTFITSPASVATQIRPNCLPRCWNQGEDPIWGAWPCGTVPVPPQDTPTLFLLAQREASGSECRRVINEVVFHG